MIFTDLTVLLLAASILIGLVATIVVGYLWRRDPYHSWLLFTLFVTCLLTEICGAYLGWIAWLRVTVGLVGVPAWTSPLTTVAVIVLTSLPTWLAFQFIRNSARRYGRRNGDHT